MIGEKISDAHAKSVLLAFIDDQIRQKTTDYHGTEIKYEKLRSEILKFTNNMGGDSGAATGHGKGPAPIQVGQVGQSHGWGSGHHQCSGDEHKSHEDEAAWALRIKGSGCFICGGPHFARECPKK